MSKVALIKLAKKLRKKFNIILGTEKAPYVSYTRRINRVKTSARICAMTFDDGPMNMPAYPGNSSKPLTKTLIEVLEKHGAKGTFDVIGTTESNYPDKEGKISTPSWGGVKYDHYPCFKRDALGGAENNSELIERIIKGGHQITNHTYTHVLYGKKNIIYSRRNTFKGFDDVHCDLLKLHNLLLERHDYKMHLSRPPHYVDNIQKGLDSYDLYSLENYLYLGASFDGAGWLPASSYENEVEAMVEPLKVALERDPNTLCGQIIFQKDGYNMALRTPVADALDKQLEILDYYGYRVVTVDELIETSPFSDVDEYDKDLELFQKLSKSYAISFTDNTLRPDSKMTLGELAVLVAPKYETVNERINALKDGKKKLGTLPSRHPYSGAVNWAVTNGMLEINKRNVNDIVALTHFKNLTNLFDMSLLEREGITRRTVLRALKK